MSIFYDYDFHKQQKHQSVIDSGLPPQEKSTAHPSHLIEKGFSTLQAAVILIQTERQVSR